MRIKRKIHYDLEVSGYYWVPSLNKWLKNEDIPDGCTVYLYRELKTIRGLQNALHNIPENCEYMYTRCIRTNKGLSGTSK
jgi:hypothetical protein